MSLDNGTCVVTLPSRFGSGKEYHVKQITAFQNLTEKNIYASVQGSTCYPLHDDALNAAKLMEQSNRTEYGVVIIETFSDVLPPSMVYTVYSKDNCPYCVQAKNILNQKNIPFVELVLGKDFSREWFSMKFPNQKTLPLILNDDREIGGLTHLIDHLNSGTN